MDRQVQDEPSQDELMGIVAEFADLVKSAAARAGEMRTDRDLQAVECELRQRGLQLLGRLLQTVTQKAVDQRQEEARTCPRCGWHRRHQGVRTRRLLSSFGSLTVRGVYWRCPLCHECGHSAEGLLSESMSLEMSGMVTLLGVSLASFDKAEQVAGRIIGVSVDDDTIRRLSERKGWEAARQQDAPPTPVREGDELLGSCDGTSVRTRESGWREVKAFRFEHAGGKYGGAYLETAEHFLPRMAAAARRVGAEHAGRRLFLSDSARWIIDGVKEQLPQFRHVADYWHACQHLFSGGESVYGRDTPKARRFGRYWSKRLRRCGAAAIEARLRDLTMCYHEPHQQRAMLDTAQFFDRHAARMDYPSYEQAGWTISSGPMESFCKQIGLRMKGPGMRWKEGNVTAMAALVSRWSLDAEGCGLFGAIPSTN